MIEVDISDVGTIMNITEAPIRGITSWTSLVSTFLLD